MDDDRLLAMEIMLEALQDEYLAALIDSHVLEHADDAFVAGDYTKLRHIYVEFLPRPLSYVGLVGEASHRIYEDRMRREQVGQVGGQIGDFGLALWPRPVPPDDADCAEG